MATALIKPLFHWHAARDFVFPRLCIVCDAPRQEEQRWLCSGCLEALHANNQQRDGCPRCGQNRKIVDCGCSRGWSYAFSSIMALFDFADPIKSVIHQVKYGAKKQLAHDLGLRFASLVPAGFLDGLDCIVPVPLHFFRRVKRGYNQTEFLARGINAGLPRPLEYLPDVLIRTRLTRTQTRLSREIRQRNLTGAFSVRRSLGNKIAGRHCLLIDDVVTTCATVDACSSTLLKNGALSVKVLALARD
jgi:ComF family protein